MKTLIRVLATVEVLLIFPAALFMSALFVRNLQPQQFEPAHTAARIVDWYAASTRVGLWLFLIGFPLAVLFIGAVTLFRRWRADADLRLATFQAATSIRAHFATLIVALTTFAAAAILAIVALHLITD